MKKTDSSAATWRKSPRVSYTQTTWRWQEDALYLTFDYELEQVAHFQHSLVLSFAESGLTPDTILNLTPFLHALGLVELISYWKCACPQEIVLKEFRLSAEQQAWWRKLWYLGLGEFRFLNHIETTQDDFVHFQNPVASLKSLPQTPTHLPTQSCFIIPVGGGKDSALTLDILKNQPGVVLIVQTNEHVNQAAYACARVAQRKCISVQRSFDPQLAQLNQAGYFNGHVPFSASLAAISLLCAALTHTRYIALSNEASANEPTVAATQINHQYSKSLEFECDFQEYTHRWLTLDVHYFSLLRPLNEVQIAAYFSHLAPYHPHFRSCNVGSRNNQWCGRCAKCLFTYILLAPFLPRTTLRSWFGVDLLNQAELEPLLMQLLGATAHKPFECVGTSEEVRACLETLDMFEPAYTNDILFQKACAYMPSLPSPRPLDQLLSHHLEPHLMPTEIFDGILLPYLRAC